jgi:hypothetical protein
MIYKSIVVSKDGRESRQALLELAGQSSYSADVYGSLDAFFRRGGYRQDADNAFIAGRNRQREHLHGLRRVFEWLYDVFIGYGRAPWRMVIPWAALVGVGCVLFSPRKMTLQRSNDAPRVYNRFWYSFDLALPVVKLDAADVWTPNPEERFLRNYTRVHTVLGWIVVPLLVASVTGLLK